MSRVKVKYLHSSLDQGARSPNRTRTQMFGFSAQASLPLALSPLTMEGPLSEAGGGEDLVVSVAEERDKVLLALLDLAQRLVVRLAQPLDHGRDSACGVGA